MERNTSIQKCGEILVDIKSKNKKNKIYIFQCTFCDIQCDQLKKFSLHIGEEHLNDFDEILKEAESLKETEILKETELKFEAEPEEFRIPSFNDVEDTPDIKVFEIPIKTKPNINPDPLDTVNAAGTSTNTDNLIDEIKYEIIEHENEMGAMDGTVLISDSDKSDSDSDEDYVEEVPLKKRKTNKNAKKGRNTKRKENTNESDSENSKEAESNVKQEQNAIKKHKRCKRRWEQKTTLTRSEIQKRYIEKLKRDEKRYEKFKQKARERNSKQYEKDKRYLQMLKSEQAEDTLRCCNEKAQLRRHRSDSRTPASTESVYIENTSSENYSNSSEDEPLIDDGSSTSSVNRKKIGYKLPNYSILSTGERKEIIMRHQEGYTYRSIAKIFNKTPASIYRVVQIFRATGRVTARRTDSKIKTVSIPEPMLSALVFGAHSTPSTLGLPEV